MNKEEYNQKTQVNELNYNRRPSDFKTVNSSDIINPNDERGASNRTPEEYQQHLKSGNYEPVKVWEKDGQYFADGNSQHHLDVAQQNNEPINVEVLGTVEDTGQNRQNYKENSKALSNGKPNHSSLLKKIKHFGMER